ncbi:iron-containing redox enzyme family protein [Actinomadura litoris]|uniref:Iron-containing redox enzyme family protein n=1 Tax=Actinomadura litoris TaxID=2678616 RepID=A0A7K1KXL5_9ACTN|nr:iron-containing redox enzyme family protein [Actinomadura litoris]MUN36899.1 iron-containing redox enzyme family protein [Actinomadura litoris]
MIRTDTGPALSDAMFAKAFPGDGSAPDMETRLALMTRLHGHYAAYLSGPESFERIPRLDAGPGIGRIESDWLRWEDAQVAEDRLPSDPEAFRQWFRALSSDHVQTAFCRYIREEASLREIALFFLAEELVDGRFDDLVALVQLGSSGASKLVMAENYWDEMGEGDLERMHTRLFDQSARYMREQLANGDVDTRELECAEVYENASLTLMYAVHRHLVPRALGAMGLMEHSAPPRFQAMVDACTRLEVPPSVIEYQHIHVHVDEDHGAEWLDHVLVPLVRRSPAALREVSMGVLTRERVANAYYTRVWSRMKAVA